MTPPTSTRASLLLLLLSCAPEQPSGHTFTRSPGWLDQIQSRIDAGGRAFARDGEAFVARAPALGLDARFSAAGATLTVEADEVRVSLQGWGRQDARFEAGPAALALGDCVASGEEDASGDCVRRLELRRDGLTEWWENRAEGLTQGWVVEAPAEGEDPLALELAVTGAEVEIEPDGTGLWLTTQGGESLLARDLHAWDAEGLPLDAWFEQVDGALLVLVDDADAVWPVTIDPVYTTVTSSLTGSATNSYFGYAVASAGDVNVDGYDDVIVGAYGVSSSAGAAYVFHGSSSGLSTTASTTLTGDTSSYFGYAVAGLGDVNGDGYPDVAVGGPAYSSNMGRVYVYHGSSSGVSSTASTTITASMSNMFLGARLAGLDANADGYADLAAAAPYNGGYNGAVLVYHGSSSGISSSATSNINGPGPNSYFGMGIASGDVNSDGYDDLIIGAYGHSSSTGRVAWHRGSSSGISTSSSTTLTGPSSSSYFGYGLALADVNGDGYDDAVVGAYAYSSSTGRVSVYAGSSSGLASSATTSLSGSSSSRFGFSVANAGDINDDGYEDVVIGMPNSPPGGAAAIYQGSSSGLSSATSTLTGSSSSAQFGYAVSGAGDANGDGYPDVIVGSPYYSSNTGRADLYLGYADNDSDGYAATVDCDDSDSSITTSITFYLDEDSDGFGVSTSTAGGCTPPDGYAAASELGYDCDDSDASINPGAEETADDGIDSDCDDEELCYLDADSDGYRGDETSTVASDDLDCEDDGEAGASLPSGDCDDDDADANPGAEEIVGNGVDEDCDQEELCYVDDDEDGYRADDSTVVSTDLDCDDEGEADETVEEGDCDDGDASYSPGQAETPDDGIDQDCDGGDSCYADLDSDGYRQTAAPYVDSDDLDCDDAGEAHSSTSTGDCDDEDDTVYPEAAEVCDGADNDCNGLTDAVIPTEGEGAWYEISVCDDSDDDGILDYTERTSLGTDPELDDSDSDGVADGTEIGLSDPEDPEVTNTSLFNADEDPSTTTDPLNPDTDGDGLLDGEEDRDANGAVDAGETDPNSADSDGGGVDDGDELGEGTNPLDASDDQGGWGGEGGDDSGGGGAGGGGDSGGGKGGCDCSTSGGPGTSGAVTLGLVALLAARRRRGG